VACGDASPCRPELLEHERLLCEGVCSTWPSIGTGARTGRWWTGDNVASPASMKRPTGAFTKLLTHVLGSIDEFPTGTSYMHRLASPLDDFRLIAAPIRGNPQTVAGPFTDLCRRDCFAADKARP
jgi:hypothetical protein